MNACLGVSLSYVIDFYQRILLVGCWIFLREIEIFLVGWSAFNPTDLVFFSESQLLGFRAWRRRRRRSLDIIVLSGRRNHPANSKP
jgi:hypothetical protein